MTILQARELAIRFGGIKAVDGITFDVAEGEIFTIIGPNGAGKTTIFNLISRIYDASGGRLLFEGIDITRVPPHEIAGRGIARTFQIVRPFANMTVLENVAVGALYGRSQAKSQRRARERCMHILDEVGLADRADMLASALTLAGRKRLEVARALATEPRLLLLDEVLAGLNATEARDALDLLRQLRKSRSLSMIVIEHVMKALMQLSERIIVLHDGLKVMEGVPAEVANDPRVIKAYLGEEKRGAEHP